MGAGKILANILPANRFNKLRKLYRKFKRFRYPALTEEKFRQVLTEKLGVKKGSVVFVHSSLDNLNIGFPLSRIFPILLDAIGEEGTLIFPCWHYTEPVIDYLKNKDSLFDVNDSPTFLGMLPELARRYPGAKRSLNPIASDVAIGKQAEEIIKEHKLSVLPCDEHSPLYKMMQYDAIIIGLGVSTFNLSFVHCVEDVMKEKFPVKTRTDEVYETKVKDENGTLITMKTRVPHSQIKYRDIEAYMKNYIPSAICCDMYINGTKYFTVNSKQLFAKMVELAQKGITIYNEKANIRNQ